MSTSPDPVASPPVVYATVSGYEHALPLSLTPCASVDAGDLLATLSGDMLAWLAREEWCSLDGAPLDFGQWVRAIPASDSLPPFAREPYPPAMVTKWVDAAPGRRMKITIDAASAVEWMAHRRYPDLVAAILAHKAYCGLSDLSRSAVILDEQGTPLARQSPSMKAVIDAAVRDAYEIVEVWRVEADLRVSQRDRQWAGVARLALVNPKRRAVGLVRATRYLAAGLSVAEAHAMEGLRAAALAGGDQVAVAALDAQASTLAALMAGPAR